MIIQIKAIANSKKPGLKQMPDGCILARIKAKPIKGRANEELIWLLARHFKAPKNQIEIIHGLRGKNKTIEIKNKPA